MLFKPRTGGSDPGPYVGKLVVAYWWLVVYSTEPWPTVCTGFLFPQNCPSWYDLYSVENNVKPQINKSKNRTTFYPVVDNLMLSPTTIYIQSLVIFYAQWTTWSTLCGQLPSIASGGDRLYGQSLSTIIGSQNIQPLWYFCNSVSSPLVHHENSCHLSVWPVVKPSLIKPVDFLLMLLAAI